MTSLQPRYPSRARAERSARLQARPHFVQFAAACLVISWLPFAVLAVLAADVDSGFAAVVFALGASGPSLAALWMRLVYRRDRVPTNVRVSMTWIVAAVALGALPPLVTALVLDGSRPALIASHAGSTIADVGGPLAALAYTLISGPLSEEFGWRGYLQPRLRARHERFATASIIGLAWGVWHLPLFFLQGTGQHDMGLLSIQGLLFFVSLFPLSYTFLFVSEQLRGGVWAAVLLHASWNLTDALMPSFGDRGAWLETGMMFAIAAGTACLSRSRPGSRPRSRTR